MVRRSGFAAASDLTPRRALALARRCAHTRRMPILLIALAMAAAVVARDTAVDTFAVANAVVAFVANGVSANFTRAEADEVPDWAAGLSFRRRAGFDRLPDRRACKLTRAPRLGGSGDGSGLTRPFKSRPSGSLTPDAGRVLRGAPRGVGVPASGGTPRAAPNLPPMVGWVEDSPQRFQNASRTRRATGSTRTPGQQKGPDLRGLSADSWGET